MLENMDLGTKFSCEKKLINKRLLLIHIDIKIHHNLVRIRPCDFF